MVQKDNNVAIVVLNYLNYQDTIECVDSILHNKYTISGIVVVDNGSTNESYQYLYRQYSSNNLVQVIKCKTNLGFAKGNNVGIKYARKHLNAQFVLVVNNDTVFTDNEYLKKLMYHYEDGVGMLGSKIILGNGTEQAPIEECLGLKDTFFAFVNAWTYDRGSSFDFPVNQDVRTQILHGCALLFTPDFFKHYRGFYKRTFLYREEPILFLMCRCRGLQQVYVSETSIYHKEDQSSEMSFQNDASVIGKYSRQSLKYVFWWSLRYTLNKICKKRYDCRWDRD